MKGTGNILRRLSAVFLSLLLLTGFSFAQAEAKENHSKAVKKLEKSEEIALKTDRSEYTQSQILAMMELTVREYDMSLADVREDALIWNSLVKGTVFNYASAEISRDLCKEYGIDTFTHVEESLVDTYYKGYLAKIEKIGEDPEEFLVKMGMTEDALRIYSEDQIYEDHLSDYLKQFIEDLSNQEGMAEYQALKNFEFRIQDEMDAKIESGEWIYNIDAMLVEE